MRAAVAMLSSGEHRVSLGHHFKMRRKVDGSKVKILVRVFEYLKPEEKPSGFLHNQEETIV